MKVNKKISQAKLAYKYLTRILNKTDRGICLKSMSIYGLCYIEDYANRKYPAIKHELSSFFGNIEPTWDQERELGAYWGKNEEYIYNCYRYSLPDYRRDDVRVYLLYMFREQINEYIKRLENGKSK